MTSRMIILPTVLNGLVNYVVRLLLHELLDRLKILYYKYLKDSIIILHKYIYIYIKLRVINI